MIVGRQIRALVALDEDRAWVILRRIVGMMYSAGCARCGCAAEAESREGQRMAKNSGRGS